MTMRITSETTLRREPLDAQSALRRAWVWYIACLAVPFVMIVCHAAGKVIDAQPFISEQVSRIGFVATLFWIGLSGAAGFLGQEYYFASYYKGQPVTPKEYLKGKVITWLCLMSGAVIAAVFMWLSQEAFPHIFAAIIAFVFTITQYPQGDAMTLTTGNLDRSQLYQTPR